MKKLCLILGDQLSDQLSSLKSLNPDDEILMAEVYAEASYVKHHPQKIALIFSAMRHFAEQLIQQGYTVNYYTLDDPNNQGDLIRQMAYLSQVKNVNEWILTEPGEWRLKEIFLNAGPSHNLDITLLEDDRFVVSHSEFQDFLKGRKQPRMEHFYRKVRQKNGLLMQNGKPVQDKWNFDHDNRKRYDGGTPPARLEFNKDQIDQDVFALVQEKFGHHFGSLEAFNWPVTRNQALRALDYFIEHYLPKFGDYQDALVESEDTLFHSLLSSSLNIGLLYPLEICQAAEQAYQAGKAPINAVEGFIRQIIGWREYVRGLYWAYMPEYGQLNALQADHDLPAFYWDESKTGMRCIAEAVRNTREHAYAHHIQRLMVTGNFALLYGAKVQEVCDWYLAVYIDAFEWVELPNTLGMALYADGGIMASKPYCSSGKYIHRMSNYCKNCIYSVQKSEGEQACPFNILYWDFLIRHEAEFKKNPRMGLTLKHVAKMTDDRQQQIISDTQSLRQRINDTGSDVPPSLQAKFNAQKQAGLQSAQQGELF